MELRGIRITFEQNDSRTFFKIATLPIEFDQYDWFVKDVDAYSDITGDKSIDIGGLIIGHELQTVVQQFNFCLFGKFVAFPSNTENLTDISTYDDFLQSNALIVVLFYDVYYYDIYCKDEMLLQSIISNASQHELQFELIDEKDSRTRLDVW